MAKQTETEAIEAKVAALQKSRAVEATALQAAEAERAEVEARLGNGDDSVVHSEAAALDDIVEKRKRNLARLDRQIAAEQKKLTAEATAERERWKRSRAMDHKGSMKALLPLRQQMTKYAQGAAALLADVAKINDEMWRARHDAGLITDHTGNPNLVAIFAGELAKAFIEAGLYDRLNNSCLDLRSPGRDWDFQQVLQKMVDRAVAQVGTVYGDD